MYGRSKAAAERGPRDWCRDAYAALPQPSQARICLMLVAVVLLHVYKCVPDDPTTRRTLDALLFSESHHSFKYALCWLLTNVASCVCQNVGRFI